jgi:rhodanese-related sulfurtransferase
MYKGDVTPTEAHEALTSNPNAVMIDVRTRAERAFVGVPAVERTVAVQWQVLPDMHMNENFVQAVEQAGVARSDTVYLICRSGARSAAAAAALTEAGYENCYNVAEGFEGGLDENRHRGCVSGWKYRGLPWIQS